MESNIFILYAEKKMSKDLINMERMKNLIGMISMLSKINMINLKNTTNTINSKNMISLGNMKNIQNKIIMIIIKQEIMIPRLKKAIKREDIKIIIITKISIKRALMKI
jgi:hypothetical protein